jgi:DNA-binding NarL/FixJ family response regulator
MNDAPPGIRVMCVDDHQIFREALAAVLANEPGLELVAEAATGEEAIFKHRVHRPDVTLMDLRLPGISGVEAIVAIRDEFPDARIVALTTELGDIQIQRVLSAGAKGYIFKGMAMSELLDVIRTAFEGKTRVPGIVAAHVVEHLSQKGLTGRELAVLERIAAGRRNKNIAQDLGIGEETVKMHVKHILAKLGASDRTHAVTIAIQRGFISLPEA